MFALFKTRRQLVLENLALRQQITMLRQSVKRPRATAADKLFWILFSRYVDGWGHLLHGLHPDTVIRWHRQGFRLYRRWKSRHTGPGRPAIDATLRNYFDYYNICRTHLSLDKNPPEPRAVEPAASGNIVALPRVGGLHHRYTRIAA